jgi:hypothetical protein
MLLVMYIVALTFIVVLSTSIAATTLAFKPKTVLSNKVIIYGLLSSLDITKLAKVVNKFLTI